MGGGWGEKKPTKNPHELLRTLFAKQTARVCVSGFVVRSLLTFSGCLISSAVC